MAKRYFLALLLVLLAVQYVTSQNMPVAPKGKALVIFTRPAMEAAILNFSYFDGEHLLSKIGSKQYVSYECSPGKHLFWAKCENLDFLEAELSAGEVYLVETKVVTGMLKARISLVAYDPTIKRADKLKNKLLERIAKRKQVHITETTIHTKDDEAVKPDIKDGLDRYHKLKSKNKKIEVLSPDMHI